jgi:hypothetical protein
MLIMMHVLAREKAVYPSDSPFQARLTVRIARIAQMEMRILRPEVRHKCLIEINKTFRAKIGAKLEDADTNLGLGGGELLTTRT